MVMLAPRKLEIIVKGFANHHRIAILSLLQSAPGLSLMAVSDRLKLDFRTASEHIRRLTIAGLVIKRNRGALVEHSLSDLGKVILKFLRNIE